MKHRVLFIPVVALALVAVAGERAARAGEQPTDDQAKAAIETFKEAAKAKEPEKLAAAIEVLGKAPHRDILKALEPHAKSKNAVVVKAVAKAAAGVADKGAAAVLLTCLGNADFAKDDKAAADAARAIAERGAPKDLLAVVLTGSAAASEVAVHALAFADATVADAKEKAKAATEAEANLVAIVTNKANEKNVAALKAVCKAAAKRKNKANQALTQALCKLVDHADPEVNKAAIIALGEIGDERAFTKVLDVLNQKTITSGGKTYQEKFVKDNQSFNESKDVLREESVGERTTKSGNMSRMDVCANAAYDTLEKLAGNGVKWPEGDGALDAVNDWFAKNRKTRKLNW
ncbi:MAG: HEAT repeat domain-containing protein [Planctomycetes bacterium]|nr:HEAT repeat domain-containing protein [Planctomycetota bacterium]